MLISTVETDGLAFFAKLAESLPDATITVETDESITPPKPVEPSIDETDDPGVWNPGFGLSLMLSAPAETWFVDIPLQPKHLRVSLE